MTKFLGLGGLILLLSAGWSCSPPPKVPVIERATIDPRIATEKIGGSVIRIVQDGDTMHGIAFASGLNVNQLAAWNNVKDTSKLRVGQRIRLTKPLDFVESGRASGRPVATNKARSTSPGKSIKRGAARSSQSERATARATGGSLSWVWPTSGKIIGRFASSQTQQGIDIQGEVGQPVVASEAGEVVYVGSGLKGYGNLVIIKHNERFLSAYAHNQETFVGEGEIISARTKIGSIGLDKQRRNALHFQIRRDGTPVNPLAYLPKR